MPPKGRKAPRADVDKMRDQLSVYSEENVMKKVEERVDSNPELISKAIEVVQMLESCNKYGKLDVIYQKELLSSLYPTWRDWITSVRATKKDFNSLFKLLAGIAPECALPSRSKASICSEVTVGPPWMNKLLEKGCPDETSTANLPQEFWKAYGWWYISEGPNNSGFSITHISGKTKRVPQEMQIFQLELKNPGDLENCQVGEGRIWVNVLSLFLEAEQDTLDMPKLRKEMPR
ncbi:unnamed protein product, partial [Symbiodinium necroappetens]